MNISPRPLLFLISGLCLLVAACASVGPDYRRPSVNQGVGFKEAQGWKQASPADDQNKGDWWTAFNDPTLNQLLARIELSNQNIAQYAAQYRQALAAAAAARANLYPQLQAQGSATRSGSSGSAGNNYRSAGATGVLDAELSLAWELDLWGKLRRGLEEQTANAEAGRADLANARLSAQSSLAQDYFALRILDQRLALYDQTIDVYRHNLEVTRHIFAGGQTTSADVAEAEAQLNDAQASRLDLVWQRAQYEHAIAILLGTPPAQFSLAVDPNYSARLPAVPVGLPSTLLERRPDIAGAERQVAAANAAIGVAVAGYYPDFSLSASGGYQNNSAHNLFSVRHRFWSLGPSMSLPLFNAGATRAEVAQARAAYDAQVASYRQSVLDALGQVEDYLVRLRNLEGEIVARRKAASAAGEAARVNFSQYREGKINYLNVAASEQSRLQQQQSLLQLLGDQLTASVQLIAALGGGWEGL